jgi:hypothetical protein
VSLKDEQLVDKVKYVIKQIGSNSINGDLYNILVFPRYIEVTCKLDCSNGYTGTIASETPLGKSASLNWTLFSKELYLVCIHVTDLY